MAEEQPTATEEQQRKRSSIPYLKNLFCMEVSDESLKKIPYPKLEVYAHAVLRGCGIMSVIGTAIGGLYEVAMTRAVNSETIGAGCLKGAKYGLMAGIPLGVIATFLKMKKAEAQAKENSQEFNLAEAYYDRAYKLRTNKEQLLMDRLALSGALIGVVAVFNNTFHLTEGASAGFAAGSLVAGTVNTIKKATRKKSADA